MDVHPIDFGAFIKSRRAELEMGLREFCEKMDLDPGNWSKIERGIFLPPDDNATLDKIAVVLDLNATQKQTLFDQADLARKQVPRDLTEDDYVLSMLPVFMRTVREVKPTQGEVEALINLLRSDFKSRK